MLLIKKAEDYIKEKISIENILKKLNEVDKIKFSIFNTDQLNIFNSINNPNFNEIFSPDKENSCDMNLLDQLWRKYEFYQMNEKEEIESYKKINENLNKNNFDENILKLVQRKYEKS